MNIPSETARELALLEHIESDPDVTQASLATQLGVAVGTVNWHLKRLIEKGYVKIKRAERKKLRYIITPEGIALRTLLTVDYIEQQFLLYRNTRQRVREHLEQIKNAGYKEVSILGEGDVADICRLSCLEQGIAITTGGNAPVLEIVGLKVLLHPDGGSHE
jgi:DNA-binding MarR family transcriptional regulator